MKTPVASEIVQLEGGPVPLVNYIQVLLHIFRYIRLCGEHSVFALGIVYILTTPQRDQPWMIRAVILHKSVPVIN